MTFLLCILIIQLHKSEFHHYQHHHCQLPVVIMIIINTTTIIVIITFKYKLSTSQTPAAQSLQIIHRTLYFNNYYVNHVFLQVDLSISHDGFLHFGDVVCLYNPAFEVLLSANMSESKMHDAKSLTGPCELSASKTLQPCVRNTFVICG